jgi:hypothetical protein
LRTGAGLGPRWRAATCPSTRLETAPLPPTMKAASIVVAVLGEERLRVCVEGGGDREEHRPTEEGHDRATTEGVREVGSRRKPCDDRTLTPEEDEEDIGHEGGGLVAVDTRDGHVRLSGRTAPPAPTVATRALSTCWLSTT